MKKILGGLYKFHKDPCIMFQSLLKFLERPMKIDLEVFKSFRFFLEIYVYKFLEK